MELTPELKQRLLTRHHTLISLARYIEGGRANFAAFLENVCQLEKSLLMESNPSAAQARLLAQIFTNESRLKQILASPEWQEASEYLLVPSNESAMLDAYYRLEIGNKEYSAEEIRVLRHKLLREAFFKESGIQGEVEFGGVPLQFVFSAKVPRWSLEGIEWSVEQHEGGDKIVGKLLISLGFPNPDGPVIYRNIFAITGSERQAITSIATHALVKNDPDLQKVAEELVEKSKWDVDELQNQWKTLPVHLQKAVEDWLKMETVQREFSETGLRLLRNIIGGMEKDGQRVDSWKDRMNRFGFLLCEREEQRVCEFCNDVATGEIILRQPTIQYYWAPEDSWETVLSGRCTISAGPVPPFLHAIYEFSQAGLLQPRPQDIEVVKSLLLYIRLEERRAAKPPLIPVYNAIRRWLEALSEKKEYKALAMLCRHAQILYPHIQIPCIGEKPKSFAGKEHTLLPRYAPEHEPGTIVGIQQAGMIVPSDKMPLCLPGIYWVATSEKT